MKVAGAAAPVWRNSPSRAVHSTRRPAGTAPAWRPTRQPTATARHEPRAQARARRASNSADAETPAWTAVYLLTSASPTHRPGGDEPGTGGAFAAGDPRHAPPSPRTRRTAAVCPASSSPHRCRTAAWRSAATAATTPEPATGTRRLEAASAISSEAECRPRTGASRRMPNAHCRPRAPVPARTQKARPSAGGRDSLAAKCPRPHPVIGLVRRQRHERAATAETQQRSATNSPATAEPDREPSKSLSARARPVLRIRRSSTPRR